MEYAKPDRALEKLTRKHSVLDALTPIWCMVAQRFSRRPGLNIGRKLPKPYSYFLIKALRFIEQWYCFSSSYPPIFSNTNCAAAFWYLERYVRWTVVSKPESQKGSLKSQYDWIHSCRAGLYCWLERRGNNPFLKDVPTSKGCLTTWRGSPIWMIAVTSRFSLSVFLIITQGLFALSHLDLQHLQPQEESQPLNQ